MCSSKTGKGVRFKIGNRMAPTLPRYVVIHEDGHTARHVQHLENRMNHMTAYKTVGPKSDKGTNAFTAEAGESAEKNSELSFC